MTGFLPATFAALFPLGVISAEKPLAAQRLHLTEKAVSTPEVKLAFEDGASVEVRAWGEEAARQVREWWPQVARLLETGNFRSPEKLVLKFKSGLKAPAFRTTEGLTVNTDWILKHPGDFGMIVHEMTHAIQDYKGVPSGAGWLVEGIADYIRYWHYEPETPRPAFNRAKASYRDGYGTTGAFLAWIIVQYDRRTVRRLDSALRAGKYSDAQFEEITGKALEPLWQEFVASRQ